MNKRSVWAVVAGVIVIIAVTTVVDVVLHLVNVYPPMDQPIDDRLALLATAYRAVVPDRPRRPRGAAMLGGWKDLRAAREAGAMTGLALQA